MKRYKHKETGQTVWAEQFVASNEPGAEPPPAMVLWRDCDSRPRDMSWGYVETLDGRKHVLSGNYIVYMGGNPCKVLYDKQFSDAYELISQPPRLADGPLPDRDHDRRETAAALYHDLCQRVSYYISEWELTNFEVGGVLAMLQANNTGVWLAAQGAEKDRSSDS